MTQKPTLKKSRNFYVPTDKPQYQNDYEDQFGPHGPTDELSAEISEEMKMDEESILVQEFVKSLISEEVKHYCEEHFEEIIAGAIALHDLKQKRKIVKASKLNKCL